MKSLKLNLSEYEFTRYKNWLENGFSQPENINTNFIFHTLIGEFHLLRHGKISMRHNECVAYCDSSYEEIYEWALAHSNMKRGETLNLHMCYAGAMDDSHPFIKKINNTKYAELIGYDTDNTAYFGIIETKEELNDISFPLAQLYAGQKIEEIPEDLRELLK